MVKLPRLFNFAASPDDRVPVVLWNLERFLTGVMAGDASHGDGGRDVRINHCGVD